MSLMEMPHEKLRVEEGGALAILRNISISS
jgi:hypothetical protein